MSLDFSFSVFVLWSSTSCICPEKFSLVDLYAFDLFWYGLSTLFLADVQLLAPVPNWGKYNWVIRDYLYNFAVLIFNSAL